MRDGELKVTIHIYKEKIINMEAENSWGKAIAPKNSIMGGIFPGRAYVDKTLPNYDLHVELRKR